MAVGRKILEIDLSQIERFTQLFDRYQEQLERTKKTWLEIDKAAPFRPGSSPTGPRMPMPDNPRWSGAAPLTYLMAKEVSEQTKAVREQASLWDRISKSTAGVAGHVVEATKSLLRWASITSAMSGLLGAGGLWGIDRLAITAGSGRRSSLGLGLSYGEQRAFGSQLSPLVDPQQFLGGVFSAMHDVTQRWSLIAAGLTQQQMQGSTADVGIALLGRLKTIADQTPEALLGNVLQARGLDRFIGLQDFERLKHTPATEIQEWQKQYSQARPLVELTQQQQVAWQKLQVQLNLAGQAIETALIRNLTPLAPQIAHLSHAFVDLINSALGSGTFKEWIDKAADGVKWFADYIGTDDFKKKLMEFGEAVSIVAKDIWAAVKWLDGLLPNSANSAAPAGQPQGGTWTGPGNHLYRRPDGTIVNPETNTPYQETSPGVFTPQLPEWTPKPAAPKPPWHLFTGPNPLIGPDAPPGGWPADPQKSFTPDGHRVSPFRAPIGSATPGAYSGSLPSGLLEAVSWTESRNHPNAISPAGAQGQYQFMPATWAQYGRGSPFDPVEARRAATRYLGKLLGEFHGDVAEAAAGYNWGEGNVERDIRQHGSDWLQYAPRETQNYVAQIMRLMQKQMHQIQTAAKPSVKIHNYTGGSAIVSASMLPA